MPGGDGEGCWKRGGLAGEINQESACQDREGPAKWTCMKPKTVIILMVLVCLGLAAGLIWRHDNATKQKKTDGERIRTLSNQWSVAEAKLSSQVEVNNTLTATVEARTADLAKAREQLTATAAQLNRAESEVKMTKAQLDATRVELTNKEAIIGDLKQRNSDLDKQVGDMKLEILDREARIAETEKRLAAAEGDREYLLRELKRLQAEKADLEKKFADLVALREQVKRIKEEVSIGKRLEWIRRGLYGNSPMKGADVVQKGFATSQIPRTNVNLNVELRRDGGVLVVPPTPASRVPTPPPSGTPSGGGAGAPAPESAPAPAPK